MISRRLGDPLANRTIKNCLLPTFVTRNMRHSNKTQLLAGGNVTSDLWGKKNQLLQPLGLHENFLFHVKFPAVPQLRKMGLNSAPFSSRHAPLPTTGVFQVYQLLPGPGFGMRFLSVAKGQERGQENPGWESKRDTRYRIKGLESHLWQKRRSGSPRLPEVLHPRAPGPSALGVTVGVLCREVHGHWVFVVELQAGKELLDDMGIVSWQVMSFLWVLINIKEPEGLGRWVWWGYHRNVVWRRWRKPTATAWQRNKIVYCGRGIVGRF